MKIISLNCSGATQNEKFFDFAKEQSLQTDIFCLQEVFFGYGSAPDEDGIGRMDMLKRLSGDLKEFNPFFSAKSFGYSFSGKQDWPVALGSAIFVRKSLLVLGFWWIPFFDTAGYLNSHPVEGVAGVQMIKVFQNFKETYVLNFHGISKPGTKLDTKERINQSERLIEVIRTLEPGARIVLCGDFNLLPQTESISMLEKSGLENLISQFSIENTRNQISWSKPGNIKQHFADFTFVSKNTIVKNFEVPYNEVSDHLPMILDIEI